MLAGRLSTEEAKKEEIKASIKPGYILHVFCDFLENPDFKFVVVLHVDRENGILLIFVVNSKIPPFIENDAHLKMGQVPLEKAVYTFFDHDSFLNCTEVRDGLDIDFTVDHLLETPKDHKGELQDTEKKKIISFVKIAQTISDDEKALIIESLGS